MESMKTKEEKEIRADALKLACEKKRSAKLLAKHGKDNLIIPDDRIPEEIKNREYNTEKERRQIRKELKAYTGTGESTDLGWNGVHI